MALNKTLSFDLELKPGGIPPIVHASQGDIGRMFKANIYWDGAAATSYISGATVNLRGKKPDKTVFDYTATLAGSMVTFETTEQMTIISGPVECELVFSNNGDVIASANFVLIVEESPYNPDAPSESVIPGIVDLIEDTIGGDVSDEVDAWLDAHPEVTTTVQDGSITEAKLADEAVTSAKVDADFLKTIENPYVTPEMFGAVGDGVTDDTAAFQALAGKVAVIPPKTYVVSSVTFPRKTRLYGSGMGCTIIKQKSGATGDLFDFADADRSALKDVTLEGNKDELDTNIYRALLKIRTTRTSQNVGYSQYCNYEHIHVRNAPSSGIVLLGRTNTDPVNPNSNYNWVLHFDDLRVEDCNNWCMIDETSDNLFSNLYLNEGDLGNFLCRSGSNMYCNLKLDQHYGGGNRGQLNGFDDGCLLLLKNAANDRFVNIDLQSAYYVGAKVYYCRAIHMDGDINNCGLGADGHGIGLLIESSNNCTFNLEFHKVNTETEYNAKINTGCTDIMVYANQADETETPNACPETCFILNQERLANVYNSTISKTMTFNNLIQNPLCSDKTWWGFSNTDNITVDTSSKTAGVNSFKVVGDRNKNIMIYKNYTSLTPGDFYLMTAVVNTETVSTSYSAINTSTMYTLMATGGADSNIYYRHKYSPRETGKSLIMQVGKVASAGDLQVRYFCYNNDGVYYIGNFLLINLRDLGIANPASINTYDALYQKLVDIMNDPFTSVSMTWDYQNIMGLLNYLMYNAAP